jgi:hypothetical protein
MLLLLPPLSLKTNKRQRKGRGSGRGNSLLGRAVAGPRLVSTSAGTGTGGAGLRKERRAVNYIASRKWNSSRGLGSEGTSRGGCPTPTLTCSASPRWADRRYLTSPRPRTPWPPADPTPESRTKRPIPRKTAAAGETPRSLTAVEDRRASQSRWETQWSRREGARRV